MTNLKEEIKYIMTERFLIIMGVNEGYFHNNENTNAKQLVSTVWQKAAKEVYENTKVYVSAIIKEGIVVYNTEWGCPTGGEVITEITCTRNPEFCDSGTRYRLAVFMIVDKVRSALKQTTCTIEGMEVDLRHGG